MANILLVYLSEEISVKLFVMLFSVGDEGFPVTGNCTQRFEASESAALPLSFSHAFTDRAHS